MPKTVKMPQPSSATEAVRLIQDQAQKDRAKIIKFFREIVAIPSMDSKIGPVGRRIAKEMKALGFQNVGFDKMGNIYGRIGKGSKVLLYDSHIDTVGLGDPKAWKWDPFKGKVENDILYARGACDEKCSTPGMIYGLAYAQRMGLLDGWTAYYFGNMEEWCDGIAPNSLHKTEKIAPDFVVIGEPTRMQIYRGHRGRLELEVVAKGKACHASMPHLGDNAIYKMSRFIQDVEALGPRIHEDPFLGRGTAVVSIIESKSPSINAVPDECTVYIDRRTTFGETKESVLEQFRGLPTAKDVEIKEMFYDTPSYTGFVFKVDKYFPAWCLPEEHPLVQGGLETRRLLGLDTKYPFPFKDRTPGESYRWDFSTNATYWAGKAGIPSIGFGPSNEVYAHTVLDQCSLEELVDSVGFYALFPSLLKKKI
ncbi:MAG TPA: YgeY family selenium metabolism-linked hydrolase [Elusimicrobiota bacterium]|nr:YgeY family selenium metabolism-linked hydrolase [Elusimicrobiota bacterium]